MRFFNGTILTCLITFGLIDAVSLQANEMPTPSQRFGQANATKHHSIARCARVQRPRVSRFLCRQRRFSTFAIRIRLRQRPQGTRCQERRPTHGRRNSRRESPPPQAHHAGKTPRQATLQNGELGISPHSKLDKKRGGERFRHNARLRPA